MLSDTEFSHYSTDTLVAFPISLFASRICMLEVLPQGFCASRRIMFPQSSNLVWRDDFYMFSFISYFVVSMHNAVLCWIIMISNSVVWGKEYLLYCGFFKVRFGIMLYIVYRYVHIFNAFISRLSAESDFWVCELCTIYYIILLHRTLWNYWKSTYINRQF